MHPILVGALRLPAELEIPVKVYAAKEDREAATVQLCAKCQSPVQFRRWCPTCLVFLEQGQLVRGVKQGTALVPLDAGEEDGPVKPERGITVTSFTPLTQVDPFYVEKSYYLEPVQPDVRLFRALRKALEVSGQAATGRAVLRTREVPAAVRPWGKTLVLHSLTPPQEVRRVSALETAPGRVGAKELRLMLDLIQRGPAPATGYPGFHPMQKT